MQSKSFSTLCSMDHLTKAWEDVKAKKAGGGIDGESVASFEIGLKENLADIREELLQGKWEPYPYLRIEIPKKKTQKRQLGMLTVKDKIVQQAIRLLFEPSCEKMFLPCSYGYRPGKGAVAAIRKTASLCRNPKNQYVLRLDIDDYFNHIDHDRLERRVRGISQDSELVRLIMLCVKMGAVTRKLSWQESEEGVHQGAVLSPCLANLYLHGFDVFVTARTRNYVRYADDFVILCQSREETESLLAELQPFLRDKLCLELNPPVISAVKDGFEFLGIWLDNQDVSLARGKKETILEHIESFYLTQNGLTRQAARRWDGIAAYYGKLLSQEALQELDQALYAVLQKNIIQGGKKFPSKTALEHALADIHFLTRQFREHEAAIKDTLVSFYLEHGKKTEEERAKDENRKIVLKRKHEYRKKEAEHAELVVTRPGMALGLAKNRVTLKENGLLIASVPPANLKHISILTDGASVSSNLLVFLSENNIPLDLFTRRGKHIGTFLSPGAIQCALWEKQALCPVEKRNALAAALIEGKLTNQLNLAKYFHKYHKARTAVYASLLEELEIHVRAFKGFLAEKPYAEADFITNLTSYEAQGALKYWAFVRSLLSDDGVGFEGRVQQGATDIVNSMLNYGYAILYSRIWTALLWAQLNPYDSIVHVRQSGKPTFSYDVIELFRAQAVDRVVISLVQKKEPVAVKDGLLTEESRRLVAKKVTERLQKRELYRGEELSLDTIIRRQVRDIADYFLDGKRYLPYKAKW